MQQMFDSLFRGLYVSDDMKAMLIMILFIFAIDTIVSIIAVLKEMCCK